MASIAQQPQPTTVERPVTPARSRVWDWLTTIDHKKIGILYGVSAIFFFLVGGFEALLIRAQLIRPLNGIVGPETYNELFTMHGTTMIFLAVMPLSVAFFNYIMPLQIGARDVAFPRLNAFSYWVFLFGGILLNASWFVGGFPGEVPNQGWYGYAPLTELAWNPTRAVDFWVLGLLVLGVSSVAGALNFTVTILNMRAPGVTLMRMPIFTWSTLIVSILIFMAFPAITIALFLLAMDRFVGTGFFEAAAGGDPLLWQHLFWVFGHPEVYILILPAFGVISEIIPTFSRKPLFGYAVMVYAIAAIAFLGFGVWAHHMFTTGLGPTANSVFAASTMLIAIPTGVKIFNWIGTMWLGQLRFTTAMLFAVGLVSQFVIGGLSGVMHAVVPVDTQQNDSYFVVAHFHYVLFGGSIFGLIAAIYYWFPKFTGRMMDERLGKWNFWTTFLGFNMTFFPMHFLGLEGMPRRYYTYAEGSGWAFWNLISTIGAFILGASILLFIYNIARSLQTGERAGANPWDAGTLEWATSSPPSVYNFAVVPTIEHRDPLWAEKYGLEEEEEDLEITIAGKETGHAHVPDENRREQTLMAAVEADTGTADIHMPNPSYYPLIAAIGFTLVAVGLLFENVDIPIGALPVPIITLVGVLILVGGIVGWSLEPPD
ncbi:MAG TPA: cytochrome c oxidase subunit I [Thermomicrobiales bacterium]|nr:cytochrome c oxidase subunit I [Thermomicrobiales bacterium]